MILQCDQCHTKFRLDDSKLKPGGVKVRCSKCRHVFLAGAEPKQEESEFDAILSGLGAPAAEPQSEAAAAAPAEEPPGFGFEEEPASAAPVPAEEPSGFGFEEEEPAAAFEVAATAGAAETVAETRTPQPAGPEITDFSDFDFPVEEFEAPAQSAAAPASDEFSAADFELPTTFTQELPQDAAAPKLEYGEFSFDEEPAPVKEAAPAASGDALDFGEFSFSSEEPEPVQEKSAAPALDFGEFEFAAEPTAPPEAPAAPAGAGGVDFGEFSFDEEPAAVTEEKAPIASEDGLDFGSFSFTEEPPVLKEEEPSAKEEASLGEFSFDEEPAVPQQSPDFAFPAVPELPEVPAEEPGSFSFSDALLSNEPKAAPAAGGFEFDDFSFAPAAAKPAEAPEAPVASARSEAAPASGAEPAAAPVPPRQPAVQPEEDFDLGPVPTKVPDHFELDEESLPPLSISSRRKGRSVLTVSIVAISILVIVVLSGAGLYLLQGGPAAFDKVGLGFVANWFGMESPEEGRITIRNAQAAFYQNKEAGELFVVTGEAVNSFRKARASIHVRVSLYDKKGAVLVQKTAYCGNRLTNDQLASLPMSKIESIMNNQFGDSLSNMGVKPGGAIGFVVALANVPKEAADFGVEVIGSTVAGK